jgi:hypothetical protein
VELKDGPLSTSDGPFGAIWRHSRAPLPALSAQCSAPCRPVRSRPFPPRRAPGPARLGNARPVPAIHSLTHALMKSYELGKVEAPNWTEFLIFRKDSNDFRIACVESKSISRSAPRKEESWRIRNCIKMQQIFEIRPSWGAKLGGILDITHGF